MTDRLRDKVAIVTGAGSGLGRASAEMFAAEGATVVCADSDASGAQGTVDAIEDAGGQALGTLRSWRTWRPTSPATSPPGRPDTSA